jgi:hypothetical protein
MMTQIAATPSPAQPLPAAGPRERRRRASEILTQLAHQDTERLSFGDVLDSLGERSFGVLLLILALVNCIPMPPGGSTVFGGTMMLVGLQLLVGLREPWFPGFIRRRAIPRAAFRAGVDRVVPYLQRIERWTRPRASWLTTGIGERLAALFVVILSFVVSMPIPIVGNIPPSIAISIIAMGLIERDGLHYLGGVAAGIAAFAINAGVVAAIVAAAIQAFGLASGT